MIYCCLHKNQLKQSRKICCEKVDFFKTIAYFSNASNFKYTTKEVEHQKSDFEFIVIYPFELSLLL